MIGFAFDQTGLSAPDQGPGYGARPSDVHTHAKKVGWRKLIKKKRKLLSLGLKNVKIDKYLCVALGPSQLMYTHAHYAEEKLCLKI